MIDFLKQMIEQIPIFIDLKRVIDTMQEIPYFKILALDSVYTRYQDYDKMDTSE